MQAMPVLEALLNKTEVVAFPFPWDEHDPERPAVMGERDLDKLSQTFLVRSDEAADIYWNDTQNRLNPLKDFGPLRLPGGSVWVEYKYPERGYAAGEWRDFPKGMWGAVVLQEKPLGGGLYRISAWEYSYIEGGERVAHVSVGEALIVDKRGYAVDIEIYTTSPDTTSDRYLQQVRSEMGDAALRQMAHSCRVGMIAVGLMNCKNVTTTETDKGGPRRRKSRGKKNPRMTYRTINIPGRNTQTEGDGTPAEKAEYALHRVRGHFKTYTAERPLMGQHVGTYWWGWQARGKAKNGISTTDYKVGTR